MSKSISVRASVVRHGIIIKLPYRDDFEIEIATSLKGAELRVYKKNRRGDWFDCTEDLSSLLPCDGGCASGDAESIRNAMNAIDAYVAPPSTIYLDPARDVPALPGKTLGELLSTSHGNEPLATVQAMESIPPGANPFHYDSFSMGTSLVRDMLIMHEGYDGPPPRQMPMNWAYFVNTRTGNRLKVVFDPKF